LRDDHHAKRLIGAILWILGPGAANGGLAPDRGTSFPKEWKSVVDNPATLRFYFHMNEVQRAILQAVAEGRLSPEEAAAMLDQAEREGDQGSGRDEPAGEPGAEPGGRARDRTATDAEPGVRRVRVVGSFRSARIVGDPTVREAIADGPHLARREDDLLIIEGAFDDAEGPGFVFNRGGRNFRLTIPPDIVGGRGGRPRRPARPARPPRPPRPPRGADPSWTTEEAWDRHSWSQSELTVRMRPDLPLEVELAAGTLRADGLTGPLRFDVRAGSARINDARGTIEAMVAAGSIRIDALLTEGASRVRCDAGSVRVNLQRGSNVLVRARPELSKLSLLGRDVVSTWTGDREEVKIGDGTATLDIDANMSKITVTAER
jgi:hypothetical protein